MQVIPSPLLVSLYALYEEDDFKRYINGRTGQMVTWKGDHNIYRWWAQTEHSGLRQWAFDTLSIPAMSAEIERVFSQAKRFITDDGNRLSPASFEALQCLKQWSNQGIYQVVDAASGSE